MDSGHLEAYRPSWSGHFGISFWLSGRGGGEGKDKFDKVPNFWKSHLKRQQKPGKISVVDFSKKREVSNFFFCLAFWVDFVVGFREVLKPAGGFLPTSNSSSEIGGGVLFYGSAGSRPPALGPGPGTSPSPTEWGKEEHRLKKFQKWAYWNSYSKTFQEFLDHFRGERPLLEKKPNNLKRQNWRSGFFLFWLAQFSNPQTFCRKKNTQKYRKQQTSGRHSQEHHAENGWAASLVIRDMNSDPPLKDISSLQSQVLF